MPEIFQFKLETKELNRFARILSGLKLQVRNRISRKALEYAATPILKTAKQLARPRAKRRNKKFEELIGKAGTNVFGKTGSIRKALVRKTEMKNGEPLVKVGSLKRAFWSNFVHQGTKPHDIKINRGPFAGRTIRHPGAKANPFLKRALEMNHSEFLVRMKSHIWQGLVKYANSQRRRLEKR